jgi:nickel-dependent lactate racemase
MKIDLAYGRGLLGIDLPGEQTTVIQPAFVPGLQDEKASVLEALNKPVSSAPLGSWIKPSDMVCIVFTDKTRATPNHKLIPWLLEYLHAASVPRSHITLLNGTGTHRANTHSELMEMLTPAVMENYRVLNHQSDDESSLVALGTTASGAPALLNKEFINAQVRIVTGFIEPHFFAGFSGGPKGIMPGIAGLKTVMSNHGSQNLGHPRSTFGVTVGNPIWEEMRDIALRAGPSFLLNVTLNEHKQITGVFAGDLVAAHQHGCEFVRKSAMQPCAAAFDVVITTNSGYPLDLNLYQGVKGMTAGARIVKPGGTIILACECCDGLPANCSYEHILRSASGPEHLLAMITSPGFEHAEQWQAQLQALVQRKANVLLYSSLQDEVVRSVHLTPCHDISAAIRDRVRASLSPPRIAVLPQGPLTIPYLN